MKKHGLPAALRSFLVAAAALAILGCDVRPGDEAAAEVDPVVKEFRETTLATDKPVIVDFYATWCPPCQDQKPLFAEAERMYGDVADFVTIDVDESPEIAAAYEIYEIPTLLIFKGGQDVERLHGVHGPEEIGAALLPYADAAAAASDES